MAETTYQSTIHWDEQPPYLHPPYKSTVERAPKQPLVALPSRLSELTAPVFGEDRIDPFDSDLTKNAIVNGEPLGERIIVTGRVMDDTGRPVPEILVEVWQTNSTGRYRHKWDQHDAPLDPNFSGTGRMLTDKKGEYRFTSIRPGAYPWKNHDNAWRPAHIHFSVFGGNFISRLITQMYFPGDPLFFQDPIFNSIPDEKGRQRMIAEYAHDVTTPIWALGFRFDIVLCGGQMTPFENMRP